MTAKTRKAYSDDRLSQAIRRGIGTDLNRRSLSRVAAFRADDMIPDRLKELLGELDRIEGQTQQSSG